MSRAWVMLALVMGCTPVIAPVVPFIVNPVPVALRTCPGGGGKPTEPGQPRTIDSLADGYNRVQKARETSEAAREVCASKLHKLNDYVKRMKH